MLPQQARGTFRKQITKPLEQVDAPPSIYLGLPLCLAEMWCEIKLRMFKKPASERLHRHVHLLRLRLRTPRPSRVRLRRRRELRQPGTQFSAVVRFHGIDVGFHHNIFYAISAQFEV